MERINQTIMDELRSSAKKYGEKPAVIHARGEISYNDFINLSSAFSRRVRRYVPKGSVVGILADLTPSFIASLFGVIGAECTYVPIDASSPLNRVAHILEYTGACALLVSESRLDLIKGLGDDWRVKKIEGDLLIARPNNVHANSLPPVWQNDVQESIACITFTSGSSGNPKAVLIPERAIINHVESWKLLMTDEERECFLLLSPPAFSLSMTAIYQPLLSGGTLVLPHEGWQSNLRYILEAFEKHRITSIKTIPSLIELLVRHAPYHEGLRNLRAITLSGEPVHWRHVDAWRAVYPHTRLFNTYGMTEAFSFTAYEVAVNTPHGVGVLPLGSATEGNFVGVFDDDGNPCAPGCRGEIMVCGKGQSAGYLNHGAFLPPVRRRVSSSDLTYTPTGDYGYIDADGVIYFSGRKDLMIKVRGYRIDPQEIEMHLETHEAVSGAGVFKEDDTDLLSCILAVDHPVSLREIIGHAEKHLPPYLVPTSFKTVSSLPRLANGKVDRMRFAKMPGQRLVLDIEPIKTNDELEKELITIWNEFLPENEFGLDSNFTEVGGDSLMLLEMLLQIEQTFGVIIEESLGAQTIRTLADCVRRAKGGLPVHAETPASSLAVRQLVPIDDLRQLLMKSIFFKPVLTYEQSAALTVSQKHRIKKEAKSKFDLTYVRVRFYQDFDERALRLALAQLINIYPALRGTIDFKEKIQTTHCIGGFANLPYFDGSGMLDEVVDEQIGGLGVMPLDLHDWPVFRWLIIKRHDCHEFVWQISHTMIDLVSGDILAGHLIELYEDFSQGRSIRMVVPTSTTSNFNLEMEKLEYPEPLLSKLQNDIGEYFQIVDERRKLIRGRGDANDGAFEKHFIEQAFSDSQAQPAQVLSAYALTIAEWTGHAIVPLRIGTAARLYEDFTNNYRHLVGQFNDHYLFTVDTSKGYVETVMHIRDTLAYFRQHSVNFDKILNYTEETDPTRYGELPWSNFFSCGPLGNVSVRQNQSGTISTVPRPLWGQGSFQPLSSGLKIGCYSFAHKGGTAIHVHSRSLSSKAFSHFTSIFEDVLNAVK